ncbi:MAG: segregation and condensation protein A [Melioribacteraceae bacterium]|nr:MAG: segregation and condensation protein A [Melioribacteraceae bacterium]
MYKIKLQQFEGPLDLLLFFIKRDEIDIYDIPISKITKDFITYIQLMKKYDLEIAGDFILMASTLMQIKVKMLLPREVDEKGEEVDPRMDLVNALLEYKRYKEVTEELAYLEANQKKLGYRANYDNDIKETPEELDTLLKNVTIYDLMLAFKKALEERPRENFHQIRKLNVSVDEQSQFIQQKLSEVDELTFVNLIMEMQEKIRIIVTFIALLEMIKMGKVGLRESANFNDFVIYGIENGSDV